MNNSNNCSSCETTCSSCGRPWAICKQEGGCSCNKCKDIKFCEYGRMANGCIRQAEPGCPMQAVIPTVTIESIEGIKNLADCLVHVSDINTTFYVDDKHRIIVTWAGPVDIPGYDMEGNPNNYRDQIVTDVEAKTAVIYDKTGKGYIFGLAENLDVQEEINNKLDRMAEDGTLADIISQYLNSTAIFGYDTVADMKAAENLTNGSFAKTLGYHAKNDGGAGLYKIRTITNDDVVDEATIIEMGDGTNQLVAELIVESPINVKSLGAYGDGIHDDTTLLQYAINKFVYHTIYFPAGDYLLSAPLDIKSGNEFKVDLELDENAKLFTNTNISALINVGKTVQGTWNRFKEGNIVTIKGGLFDANHADQAIYLDAERKQTRILNANIINVSKVGIKIGKASGSSNDSVDALIENLNITGSRVFTDNSIGIYVDGSDNEFNEIRITGVKTGILIKSGGNLFDNIHLTTSYLDNNSSKINDSIGVDIQGGDASHNFFDNTYIDTFGKSFKFTEQNNTLILNNVFTWDYLADNESRYYILYFEKFGSVKCTNCSFFFRTGSGENKTVKFGGNIPAPTKRFITIKKQILFVNCKAFNLTSDVDLFYETALNSDYDSIYSFPVEPWTISMQQNKWYKIGEVGCGSGAGYGGVHSFNLQMANDQVSRIDMVAKFSDPTITVTSLHTSTSHVNKYEIALADTYTDPDTGNNLASLLIRATDNTSSLNVCLSDIANYWDAPNFILAHATIVENPTIIKAVNLKTGADVNI